MSDTIIITKNENIKTHEIKDFADYINAHEFIEFNDSYLISFDDNLVDISSIEGFSFINGNYTLTDIDKYLLSNGYANLDGIGSINIDDLSYYQEKYINFFKPTIKYLNTNYIVYEVIDKLKDFQNNNKKKNAKRYKWSLALKSILPIIGNPPSIMSNKDYDRWCDSLYFDPFELISIIIETEDNSKRYGIPLIQDCIDMALNYI